MVSYFFRIGDGGGNIFARISSFPNSFNLTGITQTGYYMRIFFRWKTWVISSNWFNVHSKLCIRPSYILTFVRICNSHIRWANEVIHCSRKSPVACNCIIIIICLIGCASYNVLFTKYHMSTMNVNMAKFRKSYE